MEQSECVVIYGPRNSGKRSLIRSLALVWCNTADNCNTIKTIDVSQENHPPSCAETIHQAVETGGVVVVERAARETWPDLWPAARAIDGRGKVLVSLDSWRRPSGQLEGGVLWVQLRHDREPLALSLSRALIRNLASQGCIVSPHPSSLIHRSVHWIAAAWTKLSSTLMALGFSAVLHGPYLFITQLLHANNLKDMLR